MPNMQKALEELEAARENADLDIAHLSKTIIQEEESLKASKNRLHSLMELSASFSETISFIQAGIQNQILGVKIEIGEENPNG